MMSWMRSGQSSTTIAEHLKEGLTADTTNGGRQNGDPVKAIAEATARKIIEIAREPAKTFGLVDARELAGELGVSPHYVYAHATELGAMRLGLGPKARIRFDLDRARQALEARSVRPAKRRAR